MDENNESIETRNQEENQSTETTENKPTTEDVPQNDKELEAKSRAAADGTSANMVTYEEYPSNSTNRNNICKYFKIASVDGKQLWTCPAGYFCSTAESPKVPCPRGFLCPENSQQPAYCCEGWYCENSTIAEECPEGKWCPLGSVKPKTCFGLGISKCPPRTVKAPKYGIIFIFIVFFLAVAILFAIKNRVRKIKYAKYNNLLQHFMEDQKEKPEAVSINHQKFDIKFEKLGLILPSKVEIMKGVSGEFKAGRTCAIMGPSGAGKTTFVNLLTEKVRRTSGQIFINGKKDSLKKYKKLIGFVPQEDVMLRELTVQDILMHSAKMRLPKTWTNEQRKEKVLEVIQFLELDRVMDSIIGNEEERGISGGQRKRVNIGMELVADPNILFLDEPTSGLDSSTSYEVCSLLSEIAHKQNMTIVAVIHSPSAEAFEQFDDILLLGKGGRTVFFGPIEQAKEYFARIGFPCPEERNPADFFMDVTSGKIPCSLKSDFDPSDLFDFWNIHNQNPSDFTLIVHSNTKLKYYKQHLPKSFREVKVSPFRAFFSMFGDVFNYIKDIFEEIGENLCAIFRKSPIRETPNLFTVFWLDFKRACLQIYRNLGSFFLDQILHLGCGIFISVASQDFTYLPKQPNEVCSLAPPNLQKQCLEPSDQLAFTGIFVCIGVLFSGMSVGSSTFGNEKVVFWRETSSGQPTISYYLAKVFADVPRIIIAAIMFTAAFILFFPYNSSFMLIYLINLAVYFCAFAMGYFLSVIFDKKIVALASTGFSLFWALVLSGVIPDIKNYKDNFYAFLWKLSPSRWAIELFWLCEVDDFIDDIRDLPHTYTRDTWPRGFLNIILITLGWHVISYLCMKLLHRQKQK